jgi:K+-transporting ATPase ATPase C chain
VRKNHVIDSSALVLFILLTLLTGGVYPLLTTALGSGGLTTGQRLADPHERRSARLGLIGQNFTAAGYFQGALRPPRNAG